MPLFSLGTCGPGKQPMLCSQWPLAPPVIRYCRALSAKTRQSCTVVTFPKPVVQDARCTGIRGYGDVVRCCANGRYVRSPSLASTKYSGARRVSRFQSAGRSWPRRAVPANPPGGRPLCTRRSGALKRVPRHVNLVSDYWRAAAPSIESACNKHQPESGPAFLCRRTVPGRYLRPESSHEGLRLSNLSVHQ